jgi:hypothetical protein
MNDVMLTHARSHLAAVHPDPASNRLIEIAIKLRNRNGSEFWRSEWFDSAETAAQRGVQCSLTFDCSVYAGDNARVRARPPEWVDDQYRGRRLQYFGGRNVDVPCITSLPLDWDRDKGQEPSAGLALLAAAGCPPSMMLESGGGWHGRLLLAEPMLPDDGHLLAQRLCRACGGDQAVSDLRRVMRLAGTWNNKRRAWCLITDFHPERRYLGDDVNRRLDAVGVARIAARPPVAPIEPTAPPADLDRLLATCAPATRQAVLTRSGPLIDRVFGRADGGGKSWSEVDWRVIMAIVDDTDARDEQIEAIYSSMPIGQHVRERHKLGHYLSYTIKRVRQRLAEARLTARGALPSGIGGFPAPIHVSPQAAPAPTRPIIVEDRRVRLVGYREPTSGTWRPPSRDTLRRWRADRDLRATRVGPDEN